MDQNLSHQNLAACHLVFILFSGKLFVYNPQTTVLQFDLNFSSDFPLKSQSHKDLPFHRFFYS